MAVEAAQNGSALEVFLIAVLLGTIPALIAYRKGRSFGLWWFYGTAVFIAALPHSIFMKADTKKLNATSDVV